MYDPIESLHHSSYNELSEFSSFIVSYFDWEDVMKFILRCFPKNHLIFKFAILASLVLLGAKTTSIVSETLQPDLIISDIWTYEGDLCYQVRNVGEGTAPAPHDGFLEVDGVPVLTNNFKEVLAPGDRANRCLSEWACTGQSQTLFACADTKNEVSEANENNNYREEIWNCDQTAPKIIKGPLILKKTETSVEIYWETDEAGYPTVEYGQKANQYGMVFTSTQPSIINNITLENLHPGEVYQYRVSTQDLSGNLVVSEDNYFSLGPPSDTEPPKSEAPSFFRIPGPFVRYQVDIPASDNDEVDRMMMYLDESLIGIDYSSDKEGKFGIELVPGSIGTSHLDFFAPHTITTVAIDKYGLATKRFFDWSPSPEPMDGELEIVSPDEDTIFYFPEDTTTAGTDIPFSVYAAQFSGELCPPPGVGGDLECRQISEPVETIQWTINGETWENHPYATFREYHWNADSVPMGDYPLIVQAIAADGSYLTEHRTIHLRQGTPDLVVTRSVIREGHAFRVNLVLLNQGTVPLEISTVDDSVLGFQVLDPDNPDYIFQAVYNPLTRGTDIHIDLRTPSSWFQLSPGQIKTIIYRVVPLLSPEYPMEEFNIGTIPVQVRTNFSGAIETRSYSLLRTQTTDGLRFSNTIETMLTEADYLIVTNPQMIGYFDYGSGLADQLLDRLGELTKAKGGMLGYLEGAPTMHQIDDSIELWGQTMLGSDGTPGGYLRDGYLLLVGETNIIPAGAIRFSDHWYWDDLTVGLTDAFYADTSSNLIDPELMVGRIVGNNLSDLLTPIETILNMEKGTVGYGYDGSHALLLEGFPKTRDGTAIESNFESVTTIVEEKLLSKSIPFITISSPDYETRDEAILDFLNYFPGRDLLHLAGHGSSSSLDDLWTGDLHELKDAFVGSNPFVYAASCLTGRYTESSSLAERFLQAGADLYFGSTEVSFNNSNRAGSAAIFHRIIPGRSFGSIVKEVKIGFGSDYIWGFHEDYWTAEYNLYGDPELGRYPVSIDSSLSSQQKTLISTSTSLSYQIPMFIDTVYPDQQDWIEIPGGYWLEDIGQPLVPYYVIEEEIAEGTQVQDVRLASRSGMTSISNLDLPIFEDMIDSSNSNETKVPGNPEFWPGYDFNWHINQNADGSSSLLIQIFPFWYYKDAGEGIFYQNYTFDIITSPAQLKILNLTVDKSSYNIGDEIKIGSILSNQGLEPQDLILVTDIQMVGHDYSVDGLPIRLLNAVQGIVNVDQSFSTSNLSAGDYLIRAIINKEDGTMVESASIPFKVGVLAAETSNFSVSKFIFHPGDPLIFELDLANVGSEVINGVVDLQVIGSEAIPEVVLMQEIANLDPQKMTHIKFEWLTPFDLDATYRVLSYFVYGPQTTEPMEIYIQVEKNIYLPIISK